MTKKGDPMKQIHLPPTAGTGVNDDTAAFQAAINEALATGEAEWIDPPDSPEEV